MAHRHLTTPRHLARVLSLRRLTELALLMKLVHIRTKHFEADALFLGELPASRVHSVMNEPDDVKRAYRIYLLVRSALLDPERRDQYDRLSYEQATEAIRDYLRGFPVDVPLPADTREINL